MANNFGTNPLLLDSDFTSYRTAASASFGIKPSKIVLAVNTTGTSVAGTVTITRPADGVTIYPPLVVASGQAAYTELYVDDPSAKADLNWNDFAVTGLTATNTRLFVFFNI